jgi:hypothetical protein
MVLDACEMYFLLLLSLLFPLTGQNLETNRMVVNVGYVLWPKELHTYSTTHLQVFLASTDVV